MTTETGAHAAKTRLLKLLRAVRKGKSFTITNRGEAVAELKPIHAQAATDSALAVKQMKSFMREKPVCGVDIKALLDEGRA